MRERMQQLEALLAEGIAVDDASSSVSTSPKAHDTSNSTNAAATSDSGSKSASKSTRFGETPPMANGSSDRMDTSNDDTNANNESSSMTNNDHNDPNTNNTNTKPVLTMPTMLLASSNDNTNNNAYPNYIQNDKSPGFPDSSESDAKITTSPPSTSC